jgi:hypothetical protein
MSIFELWLVVEGTMLPARRDDSLTEVPVPTYSQKDLERIATAVGVSAADVLPYRRDFEAAASGTV